MRLINGNFPHSSHKKKCEYPCVVCHRVTLRLGQQTDGGVRDTTDLQSTETWKVLAEECITVKRGSEDYCSRVDSRVRKWVRQHEKLDDY